MQGGLWQRPLWVTDKKDKLPIFIPKGATGSAASPMTLRNPTAWARNQAAMSWRVVDGTSSAAPSSKAGDQGDQLRLGLDDLEGPQDEHLRRSLLAGLQPLGGGDGFNAALAARNHGVAMAAASLPAYPTNNKEVRIPADSRREICWQRHGSRRKFVDATAKDETLSKVVIWGDTSKVPEEHLKSGAVVPFAVFMAEGKGMKDGVAKVKAAEAVLTAGECVELITGTTGMPKGVLSATSRGTARGHHRGGGGERRDGRRAGLPLLPSALAHRRAGARLHDGRRIRRAHLLCHPGRARGRHRPLLQEARPTFFFGVPRGGRR